VPKAHTSTTASRKKSSTAIAPSRPIRSTRCSPIAWPYGQCRLTIGVLGCALSVALGLRLLTKIWRE